MDVKSVKNPGERPEMAAPKAPSGCCHCHHDTLALADLPPDILQELKPQLVEAFKRQLTAQPHEG